ncbi:MAG TPA: protein kinase [Kofleriaceae bacterium]|nr:protein kinase [Kofleriaceae bacterium]
MFGVQRIGRYEVLSHLASGGMGQVYLARATGLGGFERQVVVKTLDLSITDDDDSFVTMFLDEARLVGALHHQYIAPVYEVGCDEEGRYFLVMDYVHGETAEAVFRDANERKHAIPLSFALTVVSCVASALDYAHSLCAADGTPLEIVHRDISLSNVMIGYDGGVKLIDFGIAKASNRTTKTQVGTLKGKIGYLAPEQILRKHVDHRADIFSLGIVLYELTTQARAFKAGSDLITLERITKGDIVAPSKIVPDYPRELEAIVMRALEVDPDERFQDAGEMGRALESLAEHKGLRLGHGPVIDVMRALFAEKRPRRRLARSSDELRKQNQAIEADADEDTDVRSSHPRSHKPTLPMKPSPTSMPAVVPPSGADDDRATVPIMARGTRDGMVPMDHPSRLPTPLPIEEQSTGVVDPNLEVRFAHAKIPLEDRPTPIADASLIDPPTHRDAKPLVIDDTQPRERLTPPERPSGNGIAVPRTLTGQPPPPTRRATSQPPPIPAGIPPFPRSVTGPPLPPHLEDAPTEIAAMRTEREDPTDVSGVEPLPRTTTQLTPTAQLALRQKWGPAYVATAVVNRYRKKSRDTATQTWFILLGLFGVAVITAMLVALL